MVGLMKKADAEKLAIQCRNKTGNPYRVAQMGSDYLVVDGSGEEIQSIHDLDGHPGQE